MRGNGLSAASYVAIADLDPVVADAMLTVLRDAQVAAYTEPCQPALGAFLELRVPPLPCDRLYVDETAQELSRALLDEHLPALREAGRTPAVLDEERAWAELIAGYDMEPSSSVGRWPAQEDIDPERERGARAEDADGAEDADAAEGGQGGEGHRRHEPSTAGGGAGADTPPGDGEEASDNASKGRRDPVTSASAPAAARPDGPAEERYVPPPPPPLPRLDNVTKLAWLGLAGGPVLLLLAAVAGLTVPSWLAFLAVAGFVGGFLVLVARMKGGPPDNDDGAIV
jgi:hypothetical protein